MIPRSLRIMVIEDDEMVRELFTRYLYKGGHEVVAACSGEDGLKLYRFFELDLIVTDMSLTDMSGLDLARMIRRTDKHIRIIICTGCALLPGQQELSEAGITAVLQKPVRMADLVATIERSMANAENY